VREYENVDIPPEVTKVVFAVAVEAIPVGLSNVKVGSVK